jgi:hypothetical protein
MGIDGALCPNGRSARNWFRSICWPARWAGFGVALAGLLIPAHHAQTDDDVTISLAPPVLAVFRRDQHDRRAASAPPDRGCVPASAASLLVGLVV